MSRKFAERTKLNLSEVNREVRAQWDAEDVFHKSMTEREGCPSFIFFEGPPSANGHPGIHHVLARSLKDTFCRFKTMNLCLQGYSLRADRRGASGGLLLLGRRVSVQRGAVYRASHAAGRPLRLHSSAFPARTERQTLHSAAR